MDKYIQDVAWGKHLKTKKHKKKKVRNSSNNNYNPFGLSI